MTANTIFERMRGDHARVLAALDALERSAAPAAPPDGAALAPLLELLGRQFGTHMAAEDDVLFPALVRTLPETLGPITPLRDEHAELRSMLAVLGVLQGRAASPERDEQLAVQLRDFVDLLRIHIRKEEAVVFRVAERVLAPAQLQALADRMASGAGRSTATPPKGDRSKGTLA